MRLYIGVSHFTESRPHVDADRIRNDVIDPQKEKLKSIPVPVGEPIIEVVISMFITKVIAVVKTKLYLHFLCTVKQAKILIHYCTLPCICMTA